jgi:hypothetical protein
VLELKNLLLTAPDMDAQLAGFATLAAEPQFRDGDRYAVLDPASAQVGIALAAPEDHPAPGELVLTAKAAHVQAAADELVTAGAQLVKPLHEGGHEVRALVRLTGGLLVMIYGPEA